MALLSKMPPSGVSSVGTLPAGFSLRNHASLFVTPISNSGSSIVTPLYSAAISAFITRAFAG